MILMLVTNKHVRNTNIKIYRTTISSVLYECESCFLTLRKRHGLRVFGNTVLRKVFGSKKEEVKGDWRRLHIEERHDLYCSPNIIRVIKSRRMRWAGHVARVKERDGAYRVLGGGGSKREGDHLEVLGIDGRII
jgi:PAS domain-containing protein